MGISERARPRHRGDRVGIRRGRRARCRRPARRPTSRSRADRSFYRGLFEDVEFNRFEPVGRWYGDDHVVDESVCTRPRSARLSVCRARTARERAHPARVRLRGRDDHARERLARRGRDHGATCLNGRTEGATCGADPGFDRRSKRARRCGGAGTKTVTTKRRHRQTDCHYPPGSGTTGRRLSTLL